MQFMLNYCIFKMMTHSIITAHLSFPEKKNIKKDFEERE